MMAVIEAGGKQHLVRVGDEVRVERMEEKEGDKITFDSVLLTGEGEVATVGAPQVKGAKVEAIIVSHGRDKKVWGMKHKAKKRYKMKFGHKQPNTIIKIEKIA